MPTTEHRLSQLDDFERVETLARERQWADWRERITDALSRPCTRLELITSVVPLVTAFATWALRREQRRAARAAATRPRRRPQTNDA